MAVLVQPDQQLASPIASTTLTLSKVGVFGLSIGKAEVDDGESS
ncbi:hypothetical protein [Planktothrix paucivesiculata]|uniref:Uncharacterized protein n=1 Tax=Planktothrix paucivesiculata PCC 9631 TaxID=671071 RepID=A0A7Z9DZM2_9CYAN|nr:hypothetical protein [Planktothrix paucivesiculata]VXD20450.1 hypothetical protein PL9631_510031 [Planktothrix paucivesiculata PCC 9631]